MPRPFRVWLLLGAITFNCGLAHGQSTWTGSVSGSWNTAGNWSPAAVPVNSASTQLIFDATSNGVMTADIPAALNIFNLNQMTFTANAPVYSITGDTLSFHANGANAAAIAMNSPNPVMIGDPVALINNLTVNGTGTGTITLSNTISGVGTGLTATAAAALTLTGSNTYSGPTSVSESGVLAVAAIANGGAASPLGASSNAASNLALGTTTSRGNLLLTGTNANYSTDRGVTLAGVYLAGTQNYGGAIGVQNAGTTLTWNGPIVGSGTLIKSGTGTLALTNTASNYTGGTVVEGGTLATGANGTVVPVGSAVTVQSGATFDLGPYSNASAPANALGLLALSGGTLRATGATNSDFFVGQLGMTGGTIDFASTPFTWIHLTTASGITFGPSATPSSWIGGGTSRVQNDTSAPVPITAAAGAMLNAGIILSNGGTNPNFTITGAGSVRLANTGNTANIAASGGTILSNDLSTNLGTGAYGTLGTGNFALTNASFLLYDGPTATTAKPITIANSSIGVAAVGVNLTLSGPISESAPGSFFQALGPAYPNGVFGSGTVTVVGNNNYSGPTYVGYEGVLAIPTIGNGGAASPIGTSSSDPANLVLGYAIGFGGRGSLMLTGTAAAYGTDRGATVRGFYNFGDGGGAIGVQNVGTTLTWNGPITGPGELVKSGAGTLVLTNTANNFAGGTVVVGGTLTVGGANGAGVLPAGSAVAITAGATLNYAAFIDTTQAASALDTIFNEGGTFRLSGSAVRLYLNQLWCYTGSTMDLTTAGPTPLRVNLSNTGAAINVLGNSTWTGPESYVVNNTSGEVPITIAQTATLTSNVDLVSNLDFNTFTYFPFRVTGGGTLYLTGLGQNATNLIVSQGRLRVDGFTPIQATSVTLDGGTFQFSGPTTSADHGFYLGVNGGTVEVTNAATTLTLTSYIGSFGGINSGPFTKAGPGVLALTYVDTNPNRFLGGVVVNAGRLEIGDDAVLGAAATVTVNQLGTLRYTAGTTTARIFLLNNGTLDVSSGATLTLNGAAVGGGFIRGPGTVAVTGGTSLVGVTTSVNSVINQTGPGSYTNVTSGGTLSVAAGATGPITFSSFTNQGSGAITVGAGSQITAADFQTYGTLTISPGSSTAAATRLTNAGTTPIYLNGGSRTFIGTPQTAGQNLALVDLHGQNAVVAGGLFVNNGFVGDSTGSGATIVADFGSLVKGAGTFQSGVITQNGGKFQAGNSPGIAVFGQLVLGPGGIEDYNWQIKNATGVVGPQEGGYPWSLMSVEGVTDPLLNLTTSGNLTWSASAAAGSQFHMALQTLLNSSTIGNDIQGPMANFDPHFGFSWMVVQWQGIYTGPTDDAALSATANFDLTNFANPHPGGFSLHFDGANKEIDLVYTPVPEPDTLVLTAAAAGLAWSFRRRGRAR
jgi:fibronectin-binding autotransporter adhesin